MTYADQERNLNFVYIVTRSEWYQGEHIMMVFDGSNRTRAWKYVEDHVKSDPRSFRSNDGENFWQWENEDGQFSYIIYKKEVK